MFITFSWVSLLICFCGRQGDHHKSVSCLVLSKVMESCHAQLPLGLFHDTKLNTAVCCTAHTARESIASAALLPCSGDMSISHDWNLFLSSKGKTTCIDPSTSFSNSLNLNRPSQNNSNQAKVNICA